MGKKGDGEGEGPGGIRGCARGREDRDAGLPAALAAAPVALPRLLRCVRVWWVWWVCLGVSGWIWDAVDEVDAFWDAFGKFTRGLQVWDAMQGQSGIARDSECRVQGREPTAPPTAPTNNLMEHKTTTQQHRQTEQAMVALGGLGWHRGRIGAARWHPGSANRRHGSGSVCAAHPGASRQASQARERWTTWMGGKWPGLDCIGAVGFSSGLDRASPRLANHCSWARPKLRWCSAAFWTRARERERERASPLLGAHCSLAARSLATGLPARQISTSLAPPPGHLPDKHRGASTLPRLPACSSRCRHRLLAPPAALGQSSESNKRLHRLAWPRLACSRSPLPAMFLARPPLTPLSPIPFSPHPRPLPPTHSGSSNPPAACGWLPLFCGSAQVPKFARNGAHHMQSHAIHLVRRKNHRSLSTAQPKSLVVAQPRPSVCPPSCGVVVLRDIWGRWHNGIFLFPVLVVLGFQSPGPPEL